MRCLLALTAVLLTSTALAEVTVPTLDIDKKRVTVSGISAGAVMAHQLHIAYSDLFSGAAIISGGPYNCADNSLVTAMKRCMMNTGQALPVDEFSAQIRQGAEAGILADTANLEDDRVYLFHGTKDSQISALVHNATATLYADFIPADRIRQVNNVVAGHVFPAKGHGNSCTELVPPFVGDCNYDGAGELLTFLYPGLNQPNAGADTGLLQVALPNADEAELMESAYLFIPPACAEGQQSCALHLVLHGCAQSAEVIGTDFIEQSGYLPWAAANDIVLAFPQVKKSLATPLNPYGCWDWWGYTGEDYATRNGKQMAVLVGWIGGLSK